MRRSLSILIFLLVISLFAATTGKIVGRVYDSNTGEALPGVNVILVGSTMGTITDPDGYFVIFSVSPGSYSVTARMIGYREITKEGIRVNNNITCRLEFPMELSVISVQEIKIEDKEPIIKKDVNSSVVVISSLDIEVLPVNTIQGIISRHTGIINDAGYLHAHGGRSTELIYIVDGVEFIDPYTGYFDSNLPVNFIEEVSIYTGGFGVEYGNAQSGVANVITKSGGSKFSFTLKVSTNDAFGIEGLQDFIDENKSFDTTFLTVRASEGRTPWYTVFDGDTTYYEEPFDVVTYKERGTGDLKTIYVNDTLIAEDWRVEKMKKFNFTASGPIWRKNLRFFTGGEFLTSEGHHENHDDTYQNYIGKLKFSPNRKLIFNIHGLYHFEKFKEYNAEWKFNLYNLPDFKSKSYSYGFEFTHFINQKLFHKFILNNYTTNQQYNVFEDGSYDINFDGVIDEDDSDGVDDFSDLDNDRNVEVNGEEYWFDWSDQSLYPFTRYSNYDNFIYKGYYPLCWGWDEKKTWTCGWDLIAQIGRIHEMRFGILGKYHDIFDYDVYMASAGNVFVDWVKAYPYQFAGYIQEKLELNSFALKAGVRFDYFNPNSNNLPKNPEDPVVDLVRGGEIKDPIKADAKWMISPRVGLSILINEYTRLYFNSGQYFQIPPMYILFTNMNYDFTHPFPLIGNPNIKPEKTVYSEFGIQFAIKREILIDIITFIKSISNLINTEQIFYTAGDYYNRFINTDNGNAKGFEIRLKKRNKGFLRWLTWDISYTLSISRGISSSRTQNADFIWANWVLPTDEHYLNWDERHNIRSDVGLHAPEGEALFGIPGLDNFGMNMTFNYGSGFPWSPPSRTREQLINTERLPSTFEADMRFYKNFVVGQLKLGLFGDIYNLFNNDNVDNRFIFDWNDYESWYNAYGDPTGAYSDPRIHNARRFMRFGVSLKW